MTCRHCRSRLDAAGRCPGDAPLLRDPETGRHWGIAAQIAHSRGSDVTADMVRRWAYRSRQPGDKLHGLITAHHLPGRGRGTTYYDDGEMSAVERLTRLGAEHHGGQPRLGRVELTAAA